MNPGLFGYNDQFSLPIARSSQSENLENLLAGVALMDSTCRSGYGMNPDRDDPVCVQYQVVNSAAILATVPGWDIA